MSVIPYARGLTVTVRWLGAGLFLLFLSGLVYWHWHPGVFCAFDLQECFQAGFGINSIRYQADLNAEAGLRFCDVSAIMLYWLLFRYLLFLLLFWLVTKRVLQILDSIQSSTAFYIDNVRHFKSIGRLMLCATVLSCFNFYWSITAFNLHLSLAFAPLLIAVAAFVAAEIFEEGQQLREDKNLII